MEMKTFRVQSRLMGSAFELGIVLDHETKAKGMLEYGLSEIRRIEALLSEFKPASITSIVNQNAGKKPIEVNDEFFSLIVRCMAISKLSQGCFDITVSPLKKLYSFKNQNFEMPEDETISQVLPCIGWDKIELDPAQQTIQFHHPETRISFSAIGKGYASDRVKQLWMVEGIESGYINASGDLNAFGLSAEGSPWKIGIAHPDHPKQTLMYIPLQNASAATSGDYEQFFMWNNTRYSHNLNPKTGLPLQGIKSVTVFSPGAELSDALATAVYVMGSQKGISFVNQLPQTHCILVDDQNQILFSQELIYEQVKA